MEWTSLPLVSGGYDNDAVVNRALLLMDVDGVLNPYAAATCPAGFVEHWLIPDDPEPIRLCPEHGRWLVRLQKYFDLAWASSWGAETNRLLAPILGLPALPFVAMPDPPFDPALKVPAVSAFVGDRRVAWVDDELTEGAIAWAATRDPDATLLISVDPAVGLTQAITEELERFALMTSSG